MKEAIVAFKVADAEKLCAGMFRTYALATLAKGMTEFYKKKASDAIAGVGNEKKAEAFGKKYGRLTDTNAEAVEIIVQDCMRTVVTLERLWKEVTDFSWNVTDYEHRFHYKVEVDDFATQDDALRKWKHETEQEWGKSAYLLGSQIARIWGRMCCPKEQKKIAKDLDADVKEDLRIRYGMLT